jgi:hypothetical protein
MKLDSKNPLDLRRSGDDEYNYKYGGSEEGSNKRMSFMISLIIGISAGAGFGLLGNYWLRK